MRFWSKNQLRMLEMVAKREELTLFDSFVEKEMYSSLLIYEAALLCWEALDDNSSVASVVQSPQPWVCTICTRVFA